MFVLDEIVLTWKCGMLHDLYTFDMYRSLIATQFFSIPISGVMLSSSLLQTRALLIWEI